MMIVFFITIFGLIIGSFLNSIIYRLKVGGNIVNERSRCPSCLKTLRWFELLPVISFIIQRCKCRSCYRLISWQYPLVEMVVALGFVLSYLIHQTVGSEFYVLVFRDWVYIVFLVIIFVYDLKWQLILDRVTVPAMIIALFFTWGILGVEVFLWHLVAGVIAGGFFLTQFIISRGRWIGGGDIRMGLIMGFMVGWPGILVALFISYVLGALISVLIVLKAKKKWSSQIAFGTFLSFGTFITILYGKFIVGWYQSLIL